MKVMYEGFFRGSIAIVYCSYLLRAKVVVSFVISFGSSLCEMQPKFIHF